MVWTEPGCISELPVEESVITKRQTLVHNIYDKHSVQNKWLKVIRFPFKSKRLKAAFWIIKNIDLFYLFTFF